MPRTVNAHAHRVRRAAFLDIAQQLIQTKGYETMSIQDVLDALNTSRGALYHYFDSKQALLEGVVDRFADGALATLQPILDDRTLPAARKLEHVFNGIAQWKADRKDLVLAILQIWTSDANAIVREKVRRLTSQRLAPILARIIQQGIDEGAFQIRSAEGTAMVVLALLQGMQELAVEQFVGRQKGTVSFEAVQATVPTFVEALERLLGLAPNSLTLPLTDAQTLRFWFG